MQILLVNDDGIHSPGLRALADELRRLGDVQIVAPAVEQSGVSLSITFLHPLMVREEFESGRRYGWAVHGSPADCVKMGVLKFCSRRPDLIVSGINTGANVGINVHYSGTVAGAVEGAFFGITSVAVSQTMSRPPEFPRSAKFAVDLIEQLLAMPPDPGSLWNINLPENRPEWPLGVRVVEMGLEREAEMVEERLDPRGRPYYWSGLDHSGPRHMPPGTDIRELMDGYATITPLHYDLTHRAALAVAARHDWKLSPEA